MKKNAGASVWETWKFRAKTMTKRALIRFKSIQLTYVTTTIWKSVSMLFRVPIRLAHQPVLMKGKMTSFQSSTTWISASFINRVQKTKPHPLKYPYLSFSLISPAFSTKTFLPLKTFSLWIPMKKRPSCSIWKSPDSKFSNKKFMKGFYTSKTKIWEVGNLTTVYWLEIGFTCTKTRKNSKKPWKFQ